MQICKLRSCGRNRAVFLNITMVTVYKNNEERKTRALEFEHSFPLWFLPICLIKIKISSGLVLS